MLPPTAPAPALPNPPEIRDEADAPSCPPLERWVPHVATGPIDPELQAIVRPKQLAPFFERVATLLRGRAKRHIRIAVYGDSNLTMDHLTGQMRRTLQARYGDAGHGFVALGRPWSHYRHMDVQHGVRGFISYATSTKPVLDGGYGISGIAGESMYPGAKAWVKTSGDDAPIGQRASRFEVFYLKGPHWGRFDITADGGEPIEVDANAPKRGVGVRPFELDDAPHHIVFTAKEARRRIRLLGATLERGTPSFIIDSFGVGAMNTKSQAREDPEVNHAMLVHRGYDLIIFATGANDVFTLDVTPKHLNDLIERHRRALPNAPILILTPADRGKKKTFPQTFQAVEQRRKIAAAQDLALWDLFEAMGGMNAMFGFRKRGLAKSDYIHFNQAGGAYLGDRLTHALFTSLWRYLDTHPDLGCPASSDL